MPHTVHRQCTLCEAHCGIDVEVDGDRVLRITGDAEDPISRGYICPKAAALADLYADPDRLRRHRCSSSRRPSSLTARANARTRCPTATT
jgi:anaerobic selenocysteine-containing dehydrogenase